jgi:NADPH-dependent curcumin reductase CurA
MIMDKCDKTMIFVGAGVALMAMICIVLCIGLVAEYKVQKQAPAPEQPKRILLKERTKVWGRGFIIIEVDGKEYLSNYNGGIVALNPCE